MDGAPPCDSTAPMSQRPPAGCGRVMPRWSLTVQALPPLPGRVGLPALMAGLPGSRPNVRVALPFEANGASCASCPMMLPMVVPVIVQPAVLLIRLYPVEVSVPPQSFGVPTNVLPEKMVLEAVTKPSNPAPNPPAALVPAILPAMVLLFKVTLMAP